MHQAFYRKYRPQVFDDVCGQDHITSILRYECANNNVSHAYLFCGSRGTGKTTCAKILSKAINCEAPVNGNPCGKCAACRAIEDGSATDVVEMDAASNNGVDNIRVLRDEVVYSPSMLKKRVYIIDEVHMLSQSAFNALLKTLEEPPEYVVFILATTELHKLPATITSRCQKFDFRRISIDDIAGRLEYIAGQENITLAHDAAARIARIAEGGMRDAIGLFELCSAGGAVVDTERVAHCLGLSGYDHMKKFAEAVAAKDLATLLEMIAETQSSSKDISVFWGEVASFWRDMMIMKVASDPGAYLDLTESEKAALYDSARSFTMNQIAYQLGLIDEARQNMVRSPQVKRQIAEFSVLRLISPEFDKSTDALLARISALEEKVSLLEMGVTPSTPPRPEQSKAPSASARPEQSATPSAAPRPEQSAPPSEPAPAPRTVEEQPGAPEQPPMPEPDDAENESEVEEEPAPRDAVSMFGEEPPASDMLEIPDPGAFIEKLGQDGDMYRSYLLDAVIETNGAGDLVRVTVANSFAKVFLNTDQAKELIRKAALLSKIVTSPPQVEIVQSEPKGDTQTESFLF